MVATVFFDTSFLLAGMIDFGRTSIPAQTVMDAIAGREFGPVSSAWHCCLEFYAVSTRLPPEYRLSPADALRLIEEEILARFEIHQLPESARRAFLLSAERERVAGGRIYDAHIAEVARISGAGTVVTDNYRHFSSLARMGIRVLSTEAFAQTLTGH